MAKLTYVYRTEDIDYVYIQRRQLPVVAGDNLMMLMDLNSKGLGIDSSQVRGRELEEFTRKFNLLTPEERHKSLEIESTELMSVLNQCVQCVGCRRRVERLFNQLTQSGHPTLDPLVLTKDRVLTITEEKMKTPQALGTLLHRHHEILNNLLDSKLRNKPRCALHSLDAFRSKPFSETWRDGVWLSMKSNCRDELAVIETKELHEVLEGYLKKHKFCQGCRTKIEKAYKILIGEATTKEKGFVAALYANIKKCQPDKHIHVLTNKIDFLDALIRRAEPEVNGSYSKQRERHAKTLEIAQEEVLTCVGMIMYERLRRIYVSLREEERACQVLAAVGIHALSRSFDMSVENKQGVSNLELLYQELSRAERAKKLRREQKKLKKKLKKTEKKNSYRMLKMSNSTNIAEPDDEPDEAVDTQDDDDDDESEAGEVEISSDVEDSAIAKVHACNSSSEVGVVNTMKQTEPSLPLIESKKKKLQPRMQAAKAKGPQKKNKKKQKADKDSQSRSSSSCSAENSHGTNAVAAIGKCNECLAPALDCPCENDVKDSGYGSEPTSQGHSRMSSTACSLEGSEVSCSDGFCNHEGNTALRDVDDDHVLQNCSTESCNATVCHQQIPTLTLEQMLENFDCTDEGEEDCYIPQEVVLEYQCQQEKVQQERQKLRETLRQNFARLCMQKVVGFATTNCK